ncbi:MAG: hypothetical protein ACLQM8_25750 [Limisphaerales bacterium]
MSQLNRDSLGLTLDSVAESLFFGNPMPEPRRIAAAKWIAGRQGLPGSYADMFAPTVQDTLADLKTLRAGAGKWRRFPFFYTCLALTEIGPGLASAEMRYAAAYWQRNLKRLSLAEGDVPKRRAAVGQRLLEMCEM